MQGCAPGRGTSAAYRASASSYYRAVAAAQQRMAVARAAMLAREKELLSRADGPKAQWDAAEQAYAEGNIPLASRLFAALARKYRGTPVAAEARQRLTQLAEEARRKLKQIDAKLAEKESLLSPGESPGSEGPLTPQQTAERWKGLVVEAFQEYDKVAEDYGSVPEVKSELRKHVGKQRRQPDFAAVLNEPEAKTLWEEGQRHEREDHQCCAYWVYKEAAKLAPAPSAERARRRLAVMEQDPEVMASAATCRKLQECHKIYNRAKRLIEARPARAKELFAQIVEDAPADSEVHRSALVHLKEIQ